MKRGRLFTTDEANTVLPLVRSITQSIVDDFKELRRNGRLRREAIARGVDRLDCKERVGHLSATIEGYLHELASVGTEVRDLEYGIIDFPSIVNGRPAYLSWRLGDPAVSQYHRADNGFSERVPLSSVDCVTVTIPKSEAL